MLGFLKRILEKLKRNKRIAIIKRIRKIKLIITANKRVIKRTKKIKILDYLFEEVD